jgi:hypothetical protein
MDESMLENIRPSGDVAATHCALLQRYSQPIMKNGLSRSYILIGPDRIRPLFTRWFGQ